MKQKLCEVVYVKTYLGNNRAEYTCNVGHTWVADLIPKPKRFPTRLWRSPDESFCMRMALYWSKERGGVHASCPKCKRRKKK